MSSVSPAPTNPCSQSVQPQQIHVLSQSSPNKSMFSVSPAPTNPCSQSVQPQQIHVLSQSSPNKSMSSVSPAPTNPCPQSVQPQQIHVLSQSSPNKSMFSVQPQQIHVLNPMLYTGMLYNAIHNPIQWHEPVQNRLGENISHLIFFPFTFIPTHPTTQVGKELVMGLNVDVIIVSWEKKGWG